MVGEMDDVCQITRHLSGPAKMPTKKRKRPPKGPLSDNTLTE